MSAPPNGYLGTEALYAEGDAVYYFPTDYWKATRGMWFDLEMKTGIVEKVLPASFFYNQDNKHHPFKYSVLFEGQERPLTPAAENVHLFQAEHVWEL